VTRVLALDLSLSATGIARPDGGLQTLRPQQKGDDRLVEIACYIGVVADGRGPDLTIMEDVPYGAGNVAAGPLALLHGAVRFVLLDRGHRYLTVPPATLKTYATGRGNARKPDMRMELYKRTGLDVDDDNQCDARWLQLLGLDLMGYPSLELPQSHRRALDKLRLPKGVLVA
jgi:Holliday junction resolvasome RuvABC endonuclease subunit